MVDRKSSVNLKLAKAHRLAQAGKISEALVLLDKVSSIDNRNADANVLRGLLLGQIGNLEGAAECLRRAITKNPHHVLAHFNLGNIFSNLGDIKQAISAYTAAYKLDPQNPEIINKFARLRARIGHFKEAIELYQSIHKLQPLNSDVNGNLATCYFLIGELEQASKFYRLALGQHKNAAHFDGLAATLCQQGKISESIDAHSEAIMLEPDNARFHSNLLLSMNYLPVDKQNNIFQQHKQWDKKHRLDVKTVLSHSNTRDVGRRLRIAYVSPDFRTHSVAYFLEPLLENHNKEMVQVYCYACTPHQDDTTVRLKKLADYWRDISGLSDNQALTIINEDKIDILIDLSGHTAKNRLVMFSAKPAPIQVTWLGYPATTGVEVIDYRITDQLADPVENDSLYSEKLIRLHGCFLCYKPPVDVPLIQPAPVEKNGFITFGSFNNLAKINEAVVKLWSELLKTVQGSRLIIKNPSLTDLATSERYYALFAKNGVASDRIELLGLALTLEDHLNTYQLIDIALDTFPYNGTTTTCEALYMGIPVVTLSGKLHANRVGESLLTAIGQDELVAETTRQYLTIAQNLAENSARVPEYRRTLRASMLDSSLCDGLSFAKKMEQVYHDMWSTWCHSDDAL